MKIKISIVLIFVCVLAFSANVCRNRYVDSTTIKISESDYTDFINSVYRDTTSNLIKYELSFVNKTNEPPLVSSINIRSKIDLKKNVILEAIKITYLPKRGCYFEADLVGEEIHFSINPFGVKKDYVSIVDISAPGWRINKDNDNAQLVNLSNTLLNNTIHIICQIREPQKYKRRFIDFYNLYGVDFYCNMTIDSSYNFTGYYPNLPFPSIDLPEHIDKLYNPFGASISKQNLVQNNRIIYQGYLVSDANYSDDLIFNGKSPKTYMQFEFGYDFTVNTNKLIVEENKASTEQTLNEIIHSSGSSTLIALVLFGLSILISILFYLNPRGSKFNGRIKGLFRFLSAHIKLILIQFSHIVHKIIKRLASIKLNKKKQKENEI